MNEKISILIPVYNREKYIAEAIVSVQGQTYENTKIFVYDDGSEDNTVSIVKNFCVKDDRICLIEGKENKGVSYARNCLLEVCDTKYACWQDSDDLSNVNRLKYQIDVFNSFASLVLAGYRIFRNVTKVNINEEPINFVKRSNARASLLFPVNKSVRFIESKILGGEDIAWFNCMRKQYRVVIVPKVLYYVRFHSDRIGWLKWRMKGTPRKFIKNKSYKELAEMYGAKGGRKDVS